MEFHSNPENRRVSLEDKVDSLIIAVDALANQMTEILEAFPEGPLKHRIAHEAWMNKVKAEEEFWVALKKHVIFNGIWSVTLIVAGLILLGAGTYVVAYVKGH